MSIDATSWAWSCSDLRPAQKLVLLSLADRAGENNVCWPSMERLRHDTCLDIKTVRAALNDLCGMGLISRKEIPGRGYVYTLLGVSMREKRNNFVNTLQKSDVPAQAFDTPAENGTPIEGRVDTKNGTLAVIGTPTESDTPAENGTPTRNDFLPLPKTVGGGTRNGFLPLPETVPESLREPIKNRKENHSPRASAREEYPADFLRFWDSYPRKTGKKAASKAWKNAKDKPTPDALLAALERQKASSQWQSEGGRFVPHPATWLNQGRWDDEPMLLMARASPQTADPNGLTAKNIQTGMRVAALREQRRANHNAGMFDNADA